MNMASPSSSRTFRFPDIQPDEILVQVKACGMCRSDAQLIDGYFRPFADIPTPITIGHEISGVVSKIGLNVPKKAGFAGGRCRRRRAGLGRWRLPPLPRGQHAYLRERPLAGLRPLRRIRRVHPVPARYLVKADKRLSFEQIAPLTDAGLTPYRGIRSCAMPARLGRTG